MLVGDGAEYELFEIRTVILGVAVSDLDRWCSVDMFVVAMYTHAGGFSVEELGAELDVLHDLENYLDEEIS